MGIRGMCDEVRGEVEGYEKEVRRERGMRGKGERGERGER